MRLDLFDEADLDSMEANLRNNNSYINSVLGKYGNDLIILVKQEWFYLVKNFIIFISIVGEKKIIEILINIIFVFYFLL